MLTGTICLYFFAAALNIAAYAKLRQIAKQEILQSSSTVKYITRRRKSALGILLMGFTYFLLNVPLLVFYNIMGNILPQGNCGYLVWFFLLARLFPSCHCFINVAAMCWVSKKYRNAYLELFIRFKLVKGNKVPQQQPSCKSDDGKGKHISVIEDAF